MNITLRVLADSIDLNSLSSKINKEVDVDRVWRCISDIAKGSKEAALKLANSIEIGSLSPKIDTEEDIKSAITEISEEKALTKFGVNSIDLNSLSSKIGGVLQKLTMIYDIE